MAAGAIVPIPSAGSHRVKHAQLCAIGHNLADSMACGMCFVIGMYQVDMFGEAARSEGGVLTVDFLAGKVTWGEASPSLAGSMPGTPRFLPQAWRDGRGFHRTRRRVSP